ncbi:35211_t:CDS:2, partial [Racocetra persica]
FGDDVDDILEDDIRSSAEDGFDDGDGVVERDADCSLGHLRVTISSAGIKYEGYGTTSYTVGDADLTNIKVVILPSRTISKFQPIDSSIIAAFKHHYYNIANCFCYTGLFDYEISPTIREVYSNNEDSSVIADLEESLRLLSSCHLISLAHYTNPKEEMDMISADELNDITSFTNQAKLNSLHIVISLLDTTITDYNITLQILHSL